MRTKRPQPPREPANDLRRREPDSGGGEVSGASARQAWFFGKRRDPKKPRPNLILKASRNRHRLEQELRRAATTEAGPPAPPGGAGSVNWTPLGPSAVARGQGAGRPTVSGRITAIAVGPGGSRVYAGAANGGPWFSGDAGANWSPLDDYATSPAFTAGVQEDSRSVGALAVVFGASAANDVVYVGTGEPGPSDGYFGIGVRRSATGGSPGSWTTEATNLASRGIYKLVVDPDNTAVLYAATTVGLFRRPATGSLANWTQVTSPAFTNANLDATDVIAVGVGPTKRFYAAFSNDRVYSSADGVAWRALTGIPAGSGRMALAAGESAPTVYAFTSVGALLRLVGTAFQAVAGLPPANVFFRGQGWYDLVLGVDPSNDNTVFLAGATVIYGGDWNLAFLRGTITGGAGAYVFPFNAANAANPGADPTFVGQGVHADAHAFAFGLNAAGTAHDATNVWIGTDGGVFHSTASGGASTFRATNTGIAITELEYIAGRQDTDAVLFAGSQDNGTVRFWGEAAWVESPEGDGGGVAVDPNNQYQVMRQYVRAGSWLDDPSQAPGNLAIFAAGLYVSTDGGSSGSWPGLNFPPITAMTAAQKQAANAENAASGFYGPIVASPAGANPTLVCYGTNRPWLSSDWGTTWVTLPTGTNPYTPANPSAAQDVLDGQAVTAIAIASATRIYVATFRQVWRLDLAGTAWTRTAVTVAGLPAGRYITDLAVDDAAGGSFYVSLGLAGFNHLWYFDGTSWTAAGPPATTLDVPCAAVSVDPANTTIVFLGSDVGCWRGAKAGATWTWAPFSQGLPECAITDLEVHARARLLRAATHGRGAWEILLDAPSGSDPELYLRVDTADTGRLTGGVRYPWVENHPDPTRQGFTVAHWMSPDIKVRRGSLPPANALNTPPDFVDFAVNIDDYIDTTNIETADATGSNRIFVQVHNRALTGIPGAQVRVLLLLTDAAAGLPALPADYVTRINAGDVTNWVGSSFWRFADPVTPYRTLTRDLDARIPGIVEYQVDFTSLGLPAGHDHVCAAAFVTTPNDPLVGGTTSMDQLTMHDRHAAHRNLHLVALGSRPEASGSGTSPASATILVNLCNASRKERRAELVLDRPGSQLPLTVVLPRGDNLEVKGFRPVAREKLADPLRVHLGRWLEQIGEFVEAEGEAIERLGERLTGTPEESFEREARALRLRELDGGRAYVAEGGDAPSIGGIPIQAQSCVAVGVTVHAPDAKVGDRYTFSVVQREDGVVVGGSTYIVVVGSSGPESASY